MKRYVDEKKEQVEVRCNKCGRSISVQENIFREDLFHAEKVWGYFSDRDGMKHTWDLCETCYNSIINGFVIPPEEMEVIELL